MLPTTDRPPNRSDHLALPQCHQEDFACLTEKSKQNVLTIGDDFSGPDVDWPTLSSKDKQHSSQLNQTILDLVIEDDLEQQEDFLTRKDKT